MQTLVKFFGVATAEELTRDGMQADLLLGNNVLAQVNDINDFVAGLAIALKPRGVITIEFPHLMQLVEQCQFDTIYHEHFSYFSFVAAERIFAAHGLVLFDVEELPTHGGSLRIYARHAADDTKRTDQQATGDRSNYNWHALQNRLQGETHRAALAWQGITDHGKDRR